MPSSHKSSSSLHTEVKDTACKVEEYYRVTTNEPIIKQISFMSKVIWTDIPSFSDESFMAESEHKRETRNGYAHF